MSLWFFFEEVSLWFFLSFLREVAFVSSSGGTAELGVLTTNVLEKSLVQFV